MKKNKDPNFYVDSGATTLITNAPGKISQVIPYKGHDAIFVGNWEALRISHIGEARLKTKHRDLKLKKLLESPFFMLFKQYPEYRSLRIFGC